MLGWREMRRPGEPAKPAVVKTVDVQCPLMPEAFFRFLAVLLALTLPIQGMASVVAAQCMAAGHHQDGVPHESQAHEQDGADAHEHAAHSHDEAAAAQADEGGKTSHCGPCTACCASASIAGSVGISIPSSPSNTKYLFSQFPPLGFQPDGIDRPPLAL